MANHTISQAIAQANPVSRPSIQYETNDSAAARPLKKRKVESFAAVNPVDLHAAQTSAAHGRVESAPPMNAPSNTTHLEKILEKIQQPDAHQADVANGIQSLLLHSNNVLLRSSFRQLMIGHNLIAVIIKLLKNDSVELRRYTSQFVLNLAGYHKELLCNNPEFIAGLDQILRTDADFEVQIHAALMFVALTTPDCVNPQNINKDPVKNLLINHEGLFNQLAVFLQQGTPTQQDPASGVFLALSRQDKAVWHAVFHHTAGLGEALLATLKSPDTQVLENSLRALSNFARHEDNQVPLCQTKVLVIKLTALIEDERFQAFSTETLANLAGHLDNKALLRNTEDLVAGLIALLGSDNVQVQENSTCALANLAWHADNDDNIVPFCKTTHLVAGLITGLASDSVKVRGSSARGLANLACHEDNQVRLYNTEGLVAGLMTGLACDDVNVKRWSAAALGNIAKHGDNQVPLCNTAGLVVGLVKFLGSENVQVQQESACALKNLAWHKDNQVQLCNTAGLVAGLVKLLASDNVDVQQQSTLALAKLSCNKKNQVVLCETELVAGVGKLLASDDVIVQKNATRALVNLACAKKNVVKLKRDKGLVAGLVKLLVSDDREVQNNAASVLQHFYGYQNGINLEELCEIEGFIAGLIKSLTSPDRVTKQQVADVLGHVAHRNLNLPANVDIQSLIWVPGLVSGLVSNLQDVRLSTASAWAVAKLSANVENLTLVWAPGLVAALVKNLQHKPYQSWYPYLDTLIQHSTKALESLLQHSVNMNEVQQDEIKTAFYAKLRSNEPSVCDRQLLQAFSVEHGKSFGQRQLEASEQKALFQKAFLALILQQLPTAAEADTPLPWAQWERSLFQENLLGLIFEHLPSLSDETQQGLRDSERCALSKKTLSALTYPVYVEASDSVYEFKDLLQAWFRKRENPLTGQFLGLDELEKVSVPRHLSSTQETVFTGQTI